MSRRFVILAAQRTGSYMLASALDAIDGVTCHGELFRKNDRSVEEDVAILDKLDADFRRIEYRQQNADAFLEAVCRQSPPGWVGFKLMLRQAPEVQESLLRSAQYHKIILDRPNVLALYSSHRIARSTGVGFARKGEQVESPRVEFDEKDFRGFWRRYRLKYQQLDDSLRDVDKDLVLAVDYLDLLHGDAFSKILRFLGLSADADISRYIGTRKRNRAEIVDRFSNPGDVRDCLRKIDRMDWCEEL